MSEQVNVPESCIELVKRFEGYSGKAYKCPAGVLTIGYGTTRYPDGSAVKAGDTCTKEQAAEWLAHDLAKALVDVSMFCCRPLTENQTAALTSFIYNVGRGAFMRSTLRKRINAGDLDDVPYQLSRWNRAGGKVLRGLILRRAAEIDLWAR